MYSFKHFQTKTLPDLKKRQREMLCSQSVDWSIDQPIGNGRKSFCSVHQQLERTYSDSSDESEFHEKFLSSNINEKYYSYKPSYEPHIRRNSHYNECNTKMYTVDECFKIIQSYEQFENPQMKKSEPDINHHNKIGIVSSTKNTQKEFYLSENKKLTRNVSKNKKLTSGIDMNDNYNRKIPLTKFRNVLEGNHKLPVSYPQTTDDITKYIKSRIAKESKNCLPLKLCPPPVPIRMSSILSTPQKSGASFLTEEETKKHQDLFKNHCLIHGVGSYYKENKKSFDVSSTDQFDYPLNIINKRSSRITQSKNIYHIENKFIMHETKSTKYDQASPKQNIDIKNNLFDSNKDLIENLSTSRCSSVISFSKSPVPEIVVDGNCSVHGSKINLNDSTHVDVDLSPKLSDYSLLLFTSADPSTPERKSFSLQSSPSLSMSSYSNPSSHRSRGKCRMPKSVSCPTAPTEKFQEDSINMKKLIQLHMSDFVEGLTDTPRCENLNSTNVISNGNNTSSPRRLNSIFTSSSVSIPIGSNNIDRCTPTNRNSIPISLRTDEDEDPTNCEDEEVSRESRFKNAKSLFMMLADKQTEDISKKILRRPTKTIYRKGSSGLAIPCSKANV